MRNLLIGALVALAIPGTALAAKPAAKSVKSPAKACKALRAELGVTTWKLTHRNLGKCVSKHEKKSTRTPEALKAESNAAKDCKEERDTMEGGVEAFRAKYGTNDNKRNAFGKCVSAASKEDDDSEEETATAPAPEQLAEQPAPQS